MIFAMLAFVVGVAGGIVLGIMMVSTTFFSRMTTAEGLLLVIACFLLVIAFGVWRVVGMVYNQIRYQEYPPQLRPKK